MKSNHPLRKRKIIRKRRLRARVKSAHRTVHKTMIGWATRIVEFSMITACLLWGLNAQACPKDYEGKHGKSGIHSKSGAFKKGSSSNKKLKPALFLNLPDIPASLGGESQSSSGVMLLEKETHGLKISSFQAPESLLLGESLSLEFRETPSYVPTSLELVNF